VEEVFSTLHRERGQVVASVWLVARTRLIGCSTPSGKLSAQVAGSLQITPSGVIVGYRHTVETDMFDLLAPRIPQPPVINDPRHWCLPSALVVLVAEERRTAGKCSQNTGAMKVRPWAAFSLSHRATTSFGLWSWMNFATARGSLLQSQREAMNL
jgi:hypothetical protein